MHLRCMYKEDLSFNNLQWLICNKNKPNQAKSNSTYLIYMYKEGLSLNNLQWFICHKTKPNQIIFSIYMYKENLALNKQQGLICPKIQPNQTKSKKIWRRDTSRKVIIYIYIGIIVRVYTNSLGDLGSILDRVLSNTKKWYLIPSSLTLSIDKVRIKGEVSNPEKEGAPFPTARHCGYWKKSHQFAVTNFVYIYIYMCVCGIFEKLTLFRL